jgi:hypothetical protein
MNEGGQKKITSDYKIKPKAGKKGAKNKHQSPRE